MKPTQEQVIAWAREAGIPINWPGVMPYFEHFATLAYEAGRKDENEECAAIAAWILKMPENDVCAAIRARRQE